MDFFILSMIHEGHRRTLFEEKKGYFFVAFLTAIDDIANVAHLGGACTIFQGMDVAEVLHADSLRKDVKVGDGNLGKGELIGIVTVVVDEALDIPQGGHAEMLHEGEKVHEGRGYNLCLIDGCDALIQTIEGLQFKITAEGVCGEGHFVKLTRLYQSLHLTLMLSQHLAQTAEFVVNQFEHTCQTTELATVFGQNGHITLVACVVLDG